MTFVKLQKIMTAMKNKQASILFIFITILIDAIGIGLVSPILPDVIRKFNGNEEFVTTYFGYFIAVYALMLFLAAPLLGALSDKFGRRPILLIALCGAGIDYLLMAYAPNLTILFIGRIIAGLTGACLTVAMSYIADVSDDKNRTANFGMVGAAFGLGFIIGPAIGGIAGKYGHHLPFVLAAIMSLTNFIFGLFVLPESLPKEKRHQNISLRSLNPLKSVYNILFKVNKKILIWAYFLLQLALQSYGSIWALYTQHKFGWDSVQIGLSLTFVGLSVAIGQGLTARFLVPLIGEKRAIVIGLIVLFINFLIFAFAQSNFGIYLAITFILITSISSPTLQAFISRDTPKNEQGKLQGSLVSLMSFCSFIGPLIYTNIFKYSTHSLKPELPGAPFLASGVFVLICLALIQKKLKL